MLVNYRKDYEKIVMGLLSFIPDLREYNRLDDEISWENERPRQIFYGKIRILINLVASPLSSMAMITFYCGECRLRLVNVQDETCTYF